MKFHRTQRGFTLLDLMMALGISSVIILSCGVMMRMGLEDHYGASREALWERQARQTLDLVRRDLKSVFGRKWHEGHEGDSCQVGWLSLKALDSQVQSQAIGDLCAVGYVLDDELLPSGEVRRRLLRQQLDSAAVYRALVSGRAGDLWALSPDTEPIAQGVLVFEVWPLLRDGLETWQPWHPGLSPMPDAVELRLVLASPALQQRLSTREDWDRVCWDLDQYQGDEIHEVRSLIHLGVHGL